MKDPNRCKKKNMQKHKYLEWAGLKREQCGTNFVCDSNLFRKEREKYGFDRRETYDVGDSFMQWLYERLSMFTEVAGRVIDFDANHVPPYDTETTMRDAIEYVMEPLNEYIALSAVRYTSSIAEEKCMELMKETALRWSSIAPYINW